MQVNIRKESDGETENSSHALLIGSYTVKALCHSLGFTVASLKSVFLPRLLGQEPSIIICQSAPFHKHSEHATGNSGVNGKQQLMLPMVLLLGHCSKKAP
jgi:hypothetical protein